MVNRVKILSKDYLIFTQMMKKSKIPDVSAWDVNQLARTVSANPKDFQKAHTAVQEAYALAENWGTKAALQIAMIAATEMKLDLATAIAAIVGPAYLEGYVKHHEIVKRFGAKTASILQELHVLKNYSLQHNSIRKYPSHLDINDPHIIAILLQICDIMRVHCNGVALDIQETTLIYANPQLLFELKCFYIPLTHRMRLYHVQTKLADFWFKHADTLNYYAITTKLGMTKLQRKKKLAFIAEEVETAVKKHGIDFSMKQRIKSVYSIWRKIQKRNLAFDYIHDLAAIRIIITDGDHKTLAEEKIACWKVLSIISELYKPMRHVMRDWISTPRETGYESLHLAFETPNHGRLEIQIRTERMDYIAEYGSAAHWKYKAMG